jgi:ADP-ribose pyrophosphatase YjhB (NUDIX family)
VTATLAVGAVVLRGRDVLLIRRGRPPRPGTWTLPGGRVEPGETIAGALAREVREETGLVVRPARFLAAVRVGSYAVLEYLAEATGGEPCAGDDAAEARFVGEGDLAGLGVTDAVRRVIGLATRA